MKNGPGRAAATPVSLRQDLGTELLITRGDEEVALQRQQVGCDLGRFEEALRADRSAEAVAEHGGTGRRWTGWPRTRR